MKKINAEIKENRRKQLGDLIEKMRLEKGMGFNQLALKSDINVRTLNEIIYAKAKKINPFHLQKIAQALNVDYRVFYKIVEYLEDDEEISNADIEDKISIKNNRNNGSIIIGNNNNNIITSIDDDLKGLSDDEIQLVKNYINFLKSQKLSKK